MKAIDNSDFGIHKFSIFHKFFWYLLQSRRLPTRLRKRLLRYFSPSVTGPFDIHCNKLRFRLYPAQNHCDRYIVRRGKLPESEEHQALLPYIFPTMTFIDIGANIGCYSIFVSTQAKNNLTLLSFEPHPVTYKKLLYNLNLNGAPTNNIMNCALGEEKGEMDLWSDAGSNAGATSLLPINKNIKNKVSVFKLLDICIEKKIKKIDLLKIDVEGYEDRVLTTFFNESPNHLFPSTIIIETAHKDSWNTDLLNIFIDHGYKKILETPLNTIYSLTTPTNGNSRNL